MNLIQDNFQFYKRLDTSDQLYECIYINFYRTKEARITTSKCVLCDDQFDHCMTRSYRNCHYCDDESCTLKLKIESCLLSNISVVYKKGVHNDSFENNAARTSEPNDFYAIKCYLMNMNDFNSILSEVKLDVFTQLKDIKTILQDVSISKTSVNSVVKIIQFDRGLSLDFIKTYINYALDTRKYGSARFTTHSGKIDYSKEYNFVQFECKCIFNKNGMCKNKLVCNYYIKMNMLIVLWKGKRCNCDEP
ncbi:unnamed protein product [Brachionus calyciflorus]|uniref:Uncharacterized protein n=1 Tax=Brachionus calyciflorus TaxID=104777 RepID=A0A813VEG8_9BILA|nr:unnamed protein product [Brachionus calyciflorus]